MIFKEYTPAVAAERAKVAALETLLDGCCHYLASALVDDPLHPLRGAALAAWWAGRKDEAALTRDAEIEMAMMKRERLLRELKAADDRIDALLGALVAAPLAPTPETPNRIWAPAPLGPTTCVTVVAAPSEARPLWTASDSEWTASDSDSSGE